MPDKASEQITIVFAHGNASSRSIWEGVVAFLPDRFRCLTFDLPGHGAQAGPVTESFASLVEAMARVVAEAGSEPVHLVGHSLGGLICARYAQSFPEKVSSVSLLATPFERTPEQLAHAAAFRDKVEQNGLFQSLSGLKNRWYSETFARRNPEVLMARLAQLKAMDAPCFLATYGIYIDKQNETDIKTLKMPVLLLSGELADGFDPITQKRLAERTSHVTCRLYPGMKNGILTECPERIAEDLCRFISMQHKHR